MMVFVFLSLSWSLIGGVVVVSLWFSRPLSSPYGDKGTFSIATLLRSPFLFFFLDFPIA